MIASEILHIMGLTNSSGVYRSEQVLLGERIAVPDSYAPELLQRIPRAAPRTLLPHAEALASMVGVDVWQAYEASCLAEGGIPVVGLLKICVPASSQYVVESKSLKLYLHSMMGECYGATQREAIFALGALAQRDLSALLGVEVEVVPHAQRGNWWDFEGYELVDGIGLLEPFARACDELGDEASGGRRAPGELRLASRLLRSRCPITRQPDWGDVFIRLQGGRPLDRVALRNYIVRLHDENHFHETVCERIYTDLQAELSPRRLMVACLYTRRGGIDISPCRASDADFLPRYLIDARTMGRPSLRQ